MIRKRILSLAVMLVVSAFALTLQAANYLTVTDSKGEKVSFALSVKPTITFTAENLVLTAGDQTIEYPLTEYRSFTFTDNDATTGIEKTVAPAGHPVFTFGDNLHAEGLPVGSRLSVYTVSGQLVGNAVVSSNGAADISLSNINGVLLVKSATKSFKFIKK